MATDAGSSTSIPNPVIKSETPHIRKTSIVSKPIQQSPVSSPGPSTSLTSMSLTSKEWIVPPRPKPGRKPATDTPPTKRKAQNRAAQRAFRERRAARVGDLEEQLRQIEEENECEEERLKANITKLESEVERYRADLLTWRNRCKKVESELESIKSVGTPMVINGTSSPVNSSHQVQEGHTGIGCGKCTLESHCQCIDDAFDTIAESSDDVLMHHAKRPHSPNQVHTEKRVKVEPNEGLEIDFTSIYASKPRPTADKPEATSPSSDPTDRCGFCSDGTTCICAEMAAQDQQTDGREENSRSIRTFRQTDRNQYSRFTPPLSEDDVSISASRIFIRSGCTGVPGTCEQCQTDPNSTLFCKSLAASRYQSTNKSGTCCGNTTEAGSCCQSVPLPPRTTRSRAAASQQIPKQNVTLTCADAYATLSRHSAYDKASGEMATWMPKLHALDSTKLTEGRPAMEIDAANVMAVLKDFDRRFGQS